MDRTWVRPRHRSPGGPCPGGADGRLVRGLDLHADRPESRSQPNRLPLASGRRDARPPRAIGLLLPIADTAHRVPELVCGAATRELRPQGLSQRARHVHVLGPVRPRTDRTRRARTVARQPTDRSGRTEAARSAARPVGDHGLRAGRRPRLSLSDHARGPAEPQRADAPLGRVPLATGRPAGAATSDHRSDRRRDRLASSGATGGGGPFPPGCSCSTRISTGPGPGCQPRPRGSYPSSDRARTRPASDP